MFGYVKVSKVVDLISKRKAIHEKRFEEFKIKFEKETDEQLKNNYWYEAMKASFGVIECNELEIAILSKHDLF